MSSKSVKTEKILKATSNSFAVSGARIKRWIILILKKIPGWFNGIRLFCVNSLWKKYFLLRISKEPISNFPTHYNPDGYPPLKAGVCGVDDAFSRSPSLSGAYIHKIKPSNGIKVGMLISLR